MDKHTCPRRAEGFGMRMPGDDDPTPDSWREDGDHHTCSYCGSLHPDEFMRLAADGVSLGSTDKDYKVYVKVQVRGAGKFYFQHLSVEQRKAFVDLINAKSLKFEGDFGFYVLPFFVQRGARVM